MQNKFSGKQDVYIEVAEMYSNYIALGVLKYGDKLPSVRTAASQLGINPNTVAKAYALLEKRGLISSLPKKGIYVAYNNAEKPADFDSDTMLVIQSLKEKGIKKDDILKILEEVYEND